MHALIIGANSDVAYALASLLAQQEQAELTLVSRDSAALEKKAQDLHVRYAVKVSTKALDLMNTQDFSDFYSSLSQPVDLVIFAAGILGNEEQARTDSKHASDILLNNFNAAVHVLDIIALDFEQRQAGTLVAISSVAGLRGRASNAHYGAAKGGLTAYLSALRQRLSAAHAHVLTVIPGFINTKMTEGLNTPAALTASPDAVANAIYKAIKKKRHVIYTGWIWRWIMLIIRSIPERLFKKLSI